MVIIANGTNQVVELHGGFPLGPLNHSAFLRPLARMSHFVILRFVTSFRVALPVNCDRELWRLATVVHGHKFYLSVRVDR